MSRLVSETQSFGKQNETSISSFVLKEWPISHFVLLICYQEMVHFSVTIFKNKAPVSKKQGQVGQYVRHLDCQTNAFPTNRPTNIPTNGHNHLTCVDARKHINLGGEQCEEMSYRV